MESMSGRIPSLQMKCELNSTIVYGSYKVIHTDCDMFRTHRVNVTFMDKDGERHKVKGKVGDNILYLAHRYGIELEGEVAISTLASSEGAYISTLTEPVLGGVLLIVSAVYGMWGEAADSK